MATTLTMHWDELTAGDWPKAVAKAKHTCLIPLGVLEKHGDHLPIGTDAFMAEGLAARVAAREPVLIFPRYYFTQIQEAKQCPGTVAVRHDILFGLLENVCDEVGRNGLRKIILLNGHGGNESFLQYFSFYLLQRPRAYTVYTLTLGSYWSPVVESPEWKARMASEFDHHGGEAETSVMLALHPKLVRMQNLSKPGLPQQRLAHLPNVRTGMFWYADYPEHYGGDAAAASAAKGEFLVNEMVKRLVLAVRAIKRDQVAPGLEREFQTRAVRQRVDSG